MSERSLKDSGVLQRLPSVHLEDVSEIPFLDDIPGVELYQHRARVRAKQGDLFVAVTPAAEGYEAYCRELGLGDVDFEQIEPASDEAGLLAVASALKAKPDILVERAKAAGGLVLHPYMSIEPVWSLAERVKQLAEVDVFVVGPPPSVTWIANDKAAFTRLVEDELGPSWVAETKIANSAEEMGKNLKDLAGRHQTIGLKRTRCASAMGNRVFDSETVINNADEIVQAFLRDKQWPDAEEVLAVQWVKASGSPSTQLWLPPLGEGAPVVDGVYDQILKGVEQVFVGSRPSLLPEAVQSALRFGSLRVGERLQQLGYVGRLSFDFVLVEDSSSPGGLQPLFTESNARWGGTSTPMHLVDRLFDGPRPAYRAQDFVHENLVGWSFTQLREALAPALYLPDQPDGRFVLYNVGPLKGSGKFDVISLADNAAEADRLIEEELPRRLGLV